MITEILGALGTDLVDQETSVERGVDLEAMHSLADFTNFCEDVNCHLFSFNQLEIYLIRTFEKLSVLRTGLIINTVLIPCVFDRMLLLSTVSNCCDLCHSVSLCQSNFSILNFCYLYVCLCIDYVKCVGKNGIVHRITDRGDIRVQYEGTNNRWTIHPGALTKVNRAIICC